MLAMLCACGASLQASPVPKADTPFCVAVRLVRHSEIGLACTETLEACMRVSAAAQQWGEMIGIERVDRCKLVRGAK
jgi:hypothetical protein